jgi:small subunit ribosomal protein S20
MANHKSAKKRIRTNETKRLRNRSNLSAVRTTIKKFRAAAEASAPKEEVQKLFVSVQSALAGGVTKGLFHKNNASRRISRLSKLLK